MDRSGHTTGATSRLPGAFAQAFRENIGAQDALRVRVLIVRV